MQQLPEYDFAEPAHTMGLRIEALARTGRYNPNQPHRHTYCEVFLFTGGTGRHMVDFMEWPIAEGQVHFVFPGQVHQVMRSGDSEGVVLAFGEQLLQSEAEHELLTAFASRPAIQVGAAQVAELLRWIQLYQSEAQPAPGVDRHLLGIVLRKCLQWAEAQPAMAHESLMRRFAALVEARYKSMKQVSDYADALALTTEKLGEVCRLHTGRTAGTYIRDRILLEAKRLLLHSDLAVKEIAYSLGYEDPAYFNRIFLKEVGDAPQRFREQIREKYKPKRQ